MPAAQYEGDDYGRDDDPITVTLGGRATQISVGEARVLRSDLDDAIGEAVGWD